MQPKAKVGLMITTHESGKPILSHTFWAETIDQAISFAKSHLLTDAFFEASWEGTFPWRGGVLELSNHGEWISSGRIGFTDPQTLNSALEKIKETAKDIESKKKLDQYMKLIGIGLLLWFISQKKNL